MALKWKVKVESESGRRTWHFPLSLSHSTSHFRAVPTSPTNIVLIGFMGSGKTSIGRIVAKRLGFQFIDTDAVIVERARMQIAEIFEHERVEGLADVDDEEIKIPIIVNVPGSQCATHLDECESSSGCRSDIDEFPGAVNLEKQIRLRVALVVSQQDSIVDDIAVDDIPSALEHIVRELEGHPVWAIAHSQGAITLQASLAGLDRCERGNCFLLESARQRQGLLRGIGLSAGNTAMSADKAAARLKRFAGLEWGLKPLEAMNLVDTIPAGYLTEGISPSAPHPRSRRQSDCRRP